MSIALSIIIGTLFYVFVLYPTVLIVIGRLARPRAVSDYTPSVNVLIAAHNEQATIQAKIANTLASDYPADKLSILIASDASTDGTDEQVIAHNDPRARLIRIDERQGKTHAINTLTAQADSAVLVISDADVTIDPQAIRRLVRPFVDPNVGAVCGRRADRQNGANVGRPARLYNRYESALKRGEGALGRVLGGDGSLYAVRRELVRPLPLHVPDDFVTILRTIASGHKALYENEAVSREDIVSANCNAFMRRRRTVARGIRGLWSVRTLLNPFRFPFTAFLLLSHKILRWAAGYLMFAALLLNLALLDSVLWRYVFGLQTAGYAAWLIGALNVPGRLGWPFRVVRYFALANAAAVVGIWDVLRGRSWTAWERGC